MDNNLTSIKRIEAFSRLGAHLQSFPPTLRHVIDQASLQNNWFSPGYVEQAVKAIAENLQADKLRNWVQVYADKLTIPTSKTVGLVLAGNIPLVGFHDILSVLISGFQVQIKLSSDDKLLVPYLLEQLIAIEPGFKDSISYVSQLKNFDLIIATGSNNTSRYFEYYFKDVPHIIRKNRNGVAVISGEEDTEGLSPLGHDLFDYYGLGCRNVSKLYFPEDYAIRHFFEAIENYKEVLQHHKYHNNYDYHKSIYLVNGDPHLDNGFLLLKEDHRIASPLAVVYYERYKDQESLEKQLNERQEEIQCIVSSMPLHTALPVFSFGESQQPALDDYADGVNTLAFLMENR